MISETLTRRFAELNDSFSTIPFRHHEHSVSIAAGDWLRWATSAQNLIRAACGPESSHYENFVDRMKKCGGGQESVLALRGVFLAAKEDFEGGYVFNVDLRVSGEVFGDFIALAKHALSEQQKDVAAVLACAALEDVLKRYAQSLGLEVTGKMLPEVINLLKANGAFSGAQKSLVEAFPRVRNAALHAEWAKIDGPEVSSVIAFVEHLLLSKFSAP
jgi:hypothetical protein